MTNILLDTDVILDFLFDREPFSENASKVLSLCESKEITGYITPVILSNVYYLLRKTARHEKVIETLKQLVPLKLFRFEGFFFPDLGSGRATKGGFTRRCAFSPPPAPVFSPFPPPRPA